MKPKTLGKLITRLRPAYGPGMRKYQLFVFWLGMAVAVGLPAAMFIAILIVHVWNPR
jgi:hypothetical protein